MKNLSIISLSIILSACGGESSTSSNNEEKSKTEKTAATYQRALEECGEGIELTVSDNTINGSNDEYILKPEAGAKLLVSGSNNTICVGGDMERVEVINSNHDIYINGSVNELIVEGSNQNIIIFGGVLAAEVSGSNNELWLESVATYTENGTNNDIMRISNAEI